jgi:hypothetical protein
LCSEPVIAYPRSEKAFSLIVGAATSSEEEKGILGAILCQTDKKGNPRVIYYASRALSTGEKNYKTFLLEMQAACWGMDHFSTFPKVQNTLTTSH